MHLGQAKAEPSQANVKNSSECPEHVANNVKSMSKTVVNALSMWLTMSSQCQKQ